MSTSILPDDSLLIRHGPLAIHFDKKAERIRIRAVVDYDEMGGSLLYDFAMADAGRVRVEPESEGRVSVVLEMLPARRFALGPPTTEELATITAKVVADITRCSFEIPQGGQAELPGPSKRFSAADTMDEEKAELFPLIQLRERLKDPDRPSTAEDPTDPPPEEVEEDDPFAEATEFDTHQRVPLGEEVTGAESLPEIQNLAREVAAEAEQGNVSDELDHLGESAAQLALIPNEETDRSEKSSLEPDYQPASILRAKPASTAEVVIQSERPTLTDEPSGAEAPAIPAVVTVSDVAAPALEPVSELPLSADLPQRPAHATIADADIPDGVFAALIKETGLAAAESPLVPRVSDPEQPGPSDQPGQSGQSGQSGQRARPQGPDENLQTLVGDGPNRKRGEAMLELLSLASAHMPVAAVDLVVPTDKD